MLVMVLFRVSLLVVKKLRLDALDAFATVVDTIARATKGDGKAKLVVVFAIQVSQQFTRAPNAVSFGITLLGVGVGSKPSVPGVKDSERLGPVSDVELGEINIRICNADRRKVLDLHHR